MKKLLLLSLFVLAGFGMAQAQTQVRVTVENQRIVGSNFYFDVMLQDTSGSPFYLGYADIVLTNILPTGAFTSPTISYVTNSTTLLNQTGGTATGYNSTTVNPALGAGANANRILINVDFPAFTNQAEFDDRIARVDDITRRLGTFMISTNSKNAFVPNHDFHTTGAGIKTKIYEAAATTPWNQTRITAPNAFLRSSASVIDNAPATFPAEFPSSFAETIVSSTSITLNWVNGTHDGVILLYRLSDNATNATIAGLPAEDTTVANTLAYLGNANWAAAIAADTNKVGTSPYAVAYVGTGTSVTLTNLVAGEQFKYVLIPYNGVLGFSAAYASPAIMAANAAALTIDRPSVLAAPTWNVAAVAMFNTPSASSTSMDINWYIDDFTNITSNDPNYNVDNDSILFVAIGAASVSPTVAPALGASYLPTVGRSYTPNISYTGGDTLGAAPVAYAVGRARANAASGTVTFSGLTAETSYRIYAIPMRGNPLAVNAANYNLIGAIQQDVRFTTPTPVTAPDAGDLVASFTGSQNGSVGVNFTWTAPTNAGYTGLIILAREIAATDFNPVNGVVYSANADFALAPLVGTSNRVVFSGTGASASITGLNPNQRYHFTAIPYKGSAVDSNLAYTSDGPTNVWTRSDQHTWMTVSVMANLQGAWTGSANATGLAIPANQPYNTAAFFSYSGTETYNATTTPNAVDWVLLEVRRTNVGTTVADATLGTVPAVGAPNIGRRAALLLANGDIVDPANNQSILFQIEQEGEYYVVVYHRNHLPIMTAAAADTGKNVLATGAGATGDLKVSANILGVSNDNYLDFGGVVAMIAGNADNASFTINSADRTAIWAARNQSNLSLYILEDVKFDGDDLGEVDASDRAVVWNNRTRSAAAEITAP